MRGRATLQSRRTAALYTSAACSLVGIYLCLSASEVRANSMSIAYLT
jgi:hypothetical protein